MTPEERERMLELCRLIAEEKDPNAFDDLVRQLNDLLNAKQERIQVEQKQNR